MNRLPCQAQHVTYGSKIWPLCKTTVLNFESWMQLLCCTPAQNVPTYVKMSAASPQNCLCTQVHLSEPVSLHSSFFCDLAKLLFMDFHFSLLCCCETISLQLPSLIKCQMRLLEKLPCRCGSLTSVILR